MPVAKIGVTASGATARLEEVKDGIMRRGGVGEISATPRLRSHAD